MADGLKFFGLWVVALAACLVGIVPVAALGLSVPGQVVIPLAFATGGLLAALMASWLGNLAFAGGGTRSRLLPIVGWTELVAAAAFGLFVLVFFTQVIVATLFTYLVAASVLIAVGAVLATFRLRNEETHFARDAGLSLGMLVVAILVDSFGVWTLCATVLGCTA